MASTICILGILAFRSFLHNIHGPDNNGGDRYTHQPRIFDDETATGAVTATGKIVIGTDAAAAATTAAAGKVTLLAGATGSVLGDVNGAVVLGSGAALTAAKFTLTGSTSASNAPLPITGELATGNMPVGMEGSLIFQADPATAGTDAAYDVSVDLGKTAVLSGNTFFYYDTGLTSTNTVSGWCKVEPAS